MSDTTLSKTLEDLLLSEGESMTIGHLVQRVGDRGFGLLLLVLALPSALPVPAAGYSVPFGILLLVLSLQMMLGRKRPAFPARMERMTLSRKTAERLLTGAAWIFKRLEWVVRPRLRWVGSRGGRTFMGAIVLAMALLMMIPIPMTNTFPAFVIFLIGVGLTEEDGLCGVAACGIGVLAVLLYVSLVWAMIVYGPDIAITIKDTVKEWFGLQ